MPTPALFTQTASLLCACACARRAACAAGSRTSGARPARRTDLVGRTTRGLAVDVGHQHGVPPARPGRSAIPRPIPRAPPVTTQLSMALGVNQMERRGDRRFH